jgi:2',3'-cyclic-nucleotide 2'-phosphodiesterase
MKVLLIGDITGSPGRNVLKERLRQIQQSESIGFTIANAENAAGGSGVTENIANELFSYNIDVLTSGDHIWKKKETAAYIAREERLLRPANYPDSAPGFGCHVFEARTGEVVGVINLIGRVFMQAAECPFLKARECVKNLRKQTNVIFVDMHAEATSEKVAMGWFLDGLVSCVFGTHTHIQTADERLLHNHTAYITDIGMTGPMDSVIGRKKEQILDRFLTQMPVRFEMAEDDVRIHGAVVEIDTVTGHALSIKRVEQCLLS